LLNILRGTGLDGLRGIPVQRGPFIRPLLGVSRAEIIDYCEANALSPRIDPSNLAIDHYTRNRLRWELLPQLERDYNPAVRQALLRLSQIAIRDVDYLHQQAEAALPNLTLTCEAGRLVLDASKLRELHPALLRHALRAALNMVRGTLEGISHEHIEAICAALNGQRRLPFGITTPAPQCAWRVTPRRVSFHRPKT
jgi:tRNA(Ile)-lysidine synthase